MKIKELRKRLKRGEKWEIDLAGWPEGISDGLTLACRHCGKYPRFDYTVSNELWEQVVPLTWKRGVVCLTCLDFLAFEQGLDVGPHIERVQFTGLGSTTVMKPTFVHCFQFKETS